jgi:hypothetical protein
LPDPAALTLETNLIGLKKVFLNHNTQKLMSESELMRSRKKENYYTQTGTAL